MPSQKLGSDWPSTARSVPDVVVARAAPDRGDDPDRHARDHRQQHGAQGELERRGEPLPDDEEGRRAVLEGLAEVALENASQEDPVLDVERLLQPEVAVQLVHGRLRGALGEQHLRGVAGQDPEDQEDQDGHADQRDERLGDSPDEIGLHQGFGTRGA